MPVVNLNPQTLTNEVSLNPTFTPCELDGNAFPNGGNVFVILKNAHASQARTVTLTPVTAARPGSSDFPAQTVGVQTINVPALSERIVGPFQKCFTDANGRVLLTYSTNADLSIFVGRLNPL